MYILFKLINVYSLLIKEVGTGKYLTWDNTNIRLGDISQAVDFEIVKINNSKNFILKQVGTNLVLDDPGKDRNGKLYLANMHSKINQQFSFHLNSFGTFNLVVKDRKCIVNPSDSSIVFTANFDYDDGQFMLVDKGTPYFKFFEFLPIEAVVSLVNKLSSFSLTSHRMNGRYPLKNRKHYY